MERAAPTIIQTIEAKEFFLPLFRDLSTWESWLVFLKGLFGLPMMDEEEEVFKEFTGRKIIPKKQFSEAFCIVGRRGGKSFISAIISCYLALFHDWSKYLSRGEIGWILVIASDRAQARIVLNYIKDILRMPQFSDMVEKELSGEIRLKNSITMEIRTASFKGVRGYTLLAAILDELAFWRSEDSANPAGEIINALLPGLSTIPGSLLLGISTPYAKTGPLFEAYQEFYGKNEEGLPLVWKAPTRVMNPTFSESAIQKFFRLDKVAALSEYHAEFRTDLETYLSGEMIEGVTVKGRYQLPPDSGIRYLGFVDPSGGRRDSFTLAISHRDSNTGKIVLDLVRETRPPFKPQNVVEEYSKILKDYGLQRVTGDRYSGEWVVSSFRENGIIYGNSPLDKSELYLEFSGLVSMNHVELLDSNRLQLQLQSLERRTRSSGKDSVDHYPGGHDDVANSVAGACTLAFQRFKVLTAEEKELMLPQKIGFRRRERPPGDVYQLINGRWRGVFLRNNQEE